jgi:glycosyltransferase involved in cell wall biosynthesis
MVEIQADLPPTARASRRPHRVGLVCDFVEENWPSMELVADMLLDHLHDTHGRDFPATRLRPPMRRYLGRLPFSPRASYNADRLLNRFVDYPRWLRKKVPEFDLFHVIDHSYAQLVHELPPGRTVVTCHDLDTFRCLLDPESEPRPLWFRSMTARILGGFKKAAHVISVSAATRDAIMRHRLLPAERVTVISNGVHPSCSPLPDASADAELARLLPPDSTNAFWLLNVGSTLPRKRLDVLLQAFAAIRANLPHVRLLRVGGPLTPSQSQLARDAKIQDALVQLPSLNRDVLAAAYRRAHVLLHTADAEGFGLPVIEAMACGCPVIASDIPVLREVGGTTATYCPVGNIEAWRDAALNHLGELSQMPAAYQARRTSAIAQAGHFSWSKNAQQTAEIYDQVIGAFRVE